MKCLILPALLLLLASCQAPPPAATTPAASTSPAPAEPASTASTPTMAQYEQLTTGISLAEAEKIIGSKGEEVSRMDIEGVPTTIVVIWESPDKTANLTLTFQGDELTSKAQFGLK